MCWDLWLWPPAIVFPALQKQSKTCFSAAGLTVLYEVVNSIHVSRGHGCLPRWPQKWACLLKTKMVDKVDFQQIPKGWLLSSYLLGKWLFSSTNSFFPSGHWVLRMSGSNDSFWEAVESVLLVNKNLKDLRGSTCRDDGKFAVEFPLSCSVFWS